jgi:O-succinylbenzoic acid--CoA ligase
VSKTEFEWLGRYDNVINSGGIKLFPEQIEAKLSPMISSRFFIAGISDKKLGQKLVLVVEGEINKASLFQEIKSIRGLQKFEVPKEIYQIPEFYETDTGKIQRKKTLTSVDE